MLRRERRVFFTIVGAALAFVWWVKVGSALVARMRVQPAPQQVAGPVLTAMLEERSTPTPLLLVLNPAVAAGPEVDATPAAPRQVLNPAVSPIPQVAPTPTPGELADPVCAAYYQSSSSPDFIQGTWSDSPEATQSLQACYDWMRRTILRKSRCAQAGARAVVVVLVDESRHAFDLPDNLNMSSEFVVRQECVR